MSEGNVRKFPVKAFDRIRNKRGKRSVSCLVTDRWFQFAESSDQLPDGNYVFVDVMTGGYDEPAKKICSLCISKEELAKALDNVS